ncbi:hypothetical protein ACOMHN_002887 [Nucella lapillus]
MDLWTIVLGLCIGVLLSVLIYFITRMSMKERSYEEVIAEQRKRQEAEREKVRSDKKMEKEFMKKKFKKGKGDKTKEKPAQAFDPKIKTDTDKKARVQKEPKMVNLKIEPEIIEPTKSEVSGSKKSKKDSSARKRSILHNKDEVTPVSEKAAELDHKPVKPLDDIELKKFHDSKKEVPAAKKGKGQQTDQKQVKEQPIQKAKTTSLQHAVAAEEKGTKSKSPTAVKGNPLVDTLRTADLSAAEVQSLMDVLLHHRGAAGVDFQGSWNKKGQKGDPVTVMKKQLEEKERALHEEQQRAASSANQVKELRASQAAEREKLSGLEKRYQSQLSQQEAEKEAIKARLASTHSAHMADTAKLKLQLEQVQGEKSSESAAFLQLKQENKILQESLSKLVADNASKGDLSGLKQKVSILEKELSNSTVRLNAAENAKKSGDVKLKKYEEQIKHLESTKKSSEDSLKKQATEAKEGARKTDSQNAQMSKDLQKATGALSTVEAECAMWKTKLQELEKHLSSLGDVSAKLQQSEDKKQEVESNLKNLEKQLAEAVRSRQDITTQLQQLRQENSALSQELKVTQEKQQTQTSSAMNANGDVHDEKDKNFIKTAEHDRIVSEKVAELSKIQRALDAQTQKNNELRQKNWKAMEALENTEKLAAKKIDKALKSSREEVKQAVSEMQKTDRAVIKRLFPALSLSDSMEHKEWLSSFEKQAIQLLDRSSNSEKSLCNKLSHLEEENDRLKADVEVFKNNIAILHSEKERIHQLEEENKKLQHQSESYEKNFMQLNADQEKMLHLEEENQRLLKQSSASNSSLSEDISRLQEENQNLQCRLQEKEENITEVESKLHSLECVVETGEKKWNEKLRQAEDSAAKKPEPSSREQELEDLMVQQQSQIEHYRTVLTNTEQLLRQLESAEKAWEEKLNASQDDLQKSQAQCQKAQEELHALRGGTEDLSDLGFAYRCVEKSLTSIVDEMQGKVIDLEEELRHSHEKLDGLNKEKEELTSRVIVMESQSKAIVQVGTEDLKKDLSELRDQLEVERKRNKELSSTLVRLNGIIKTGQDALSQEQKVVQQLQEQLTNKTKGSASGVNQEIEQLRSKLSEKEKQLEREIAANKQLSQRLGQLGVLGTPKGSDPGTSL